MVIRQLPSGRQTPLQYFQSDCKLGPEYMYLCSVCGYDRLEDPPKNFTICPSCGTEFGYDDAFASHAELRAKWLRNGAQWWSTVDPKPEHWDQQQQVDVVMSSHQR